MIIANDRSPVNPGFFAAMALPDPPPVVPCTVTLRSITYRCPFCGRRHRHHMAGTVWRDGIASKATHCRVQRRRFPGGHDAVRLIIA